MLKIFRDCSLIGVVLFISVLLFGFSFRLMGLELISVWGDEVASLYYAQHLDRIFAGESHSPFYYVLCRLWISLFPATILSLRYMFITMSALTTGLSTYLIYKKKAPWLWLVFLSLWWLWPTDIILSRQARHYGLYAELTFLILILWEFRGDFNKRLIWPVWVLYQFVHPFTLIPVWFLASYDLGMKKLTLKEFGFYLSSSFPLLLYYLIRFSLQGKEKVLSNIGWISNDFETFFKSVVLLFVGESFPLTYVYPLSREVSLIFLALVLISFFVFRKKEISYRAYHQILKFFLLFLVTLLFVELSSFLITNIRVSRYFVFVVPFFLYGLMELINGIGKNKSLALAGILSLILGAYSTEYFRPWRPYQWDDQNVESFRNFYQTLPSGELVICANAFQLDYYFHREYQACSEVALKLHLKKQNFYLFDLTGNDRFLTLFLMNNSRIDKIMKFNQAVFLSVTY